MKTNCTVGLLAGALLLVGIGCGPGDEEEEGYEVSSSDLTGDIAGESFAVGSGFASDPFEDGEYWIELHASEVDDPCDPFAYESEPHIIISTTPEPKDVGLSLSNNITFAYPDGDSSQNDISTQGRLIIDQANEETVKGGLYAIFSSDGKSHEVDGQFSVPFCADR